MRRLLTAFMNNKEKSSYIFVHNLNEQEVHTHTHTQGCFAGVPLVYILPPACYLKLSKQPWSSRGKIISVLLVILGVFVMVLGTIQTSIQVSF